MYGGLTLRKNQKSELIKLLQECKRVIHPANYPDMTIGEYSSIVHKLDATVEALYEELK